MIDIREIQETYEKIKNEIEILEGNKSHEYKRIAYLIAR